MPRITEMSEATGLSNNDYVLIDSPTKGTRKYLASNFSQGGGGGGGTTLNTIYSGKESQYISDAINVGHAFDVRTVGEDFDEYLSTSDYATFTVLKDFDAVVTVGVMEDANHTGVNPPSCSFYINGITTHNDNDTVTGVLGVTASSGEPLATGYTHFLMSFRTGDTFFWGSRTSRGWTVRLGQIDVINGLDMSDYVQPTF